MGRRLGAGVLSACLAGLVFGAAPRAAAQPDADRVRMLEDLTKRIYLVSSLQKAGNLAEAVRQAETAVALAEQVFGDRSANTAGWYKVLGELYHDQERLVLARKQYERCLTIYPPGGGESAAILNNLGELCRDCGDLDNAEKFHLASLADRRRALGPDHPAVAQSLNNLALVFHARGQADRAEEYFKHGLDLARKGAPPDAPVVQVLLHNQANFYTDAGLPEKANGPLHENLTLLIEKRGPEHPALLPTLLALENRYRASGQYGQAETAALRALGIADKKLPAHHPSRVDAALALAEVYRLRGKYAQAEQVLRDLGKNLPDGHPKWPAILNNLGVVFQHMGRFAEAEKLLGASLLLRRELLGADHSSTSVSHNNLGDLYQEMRKYDLAEQQYQACLAVNERAFPPGHPRLAATLQNLAIVYRAQGQYDKAVSLYESSLRITTKNRGEHHPETALAAFNLGVVHRARGDLDRAEDCLRRSLKVFEDRLDPDHPQLQLCLNSLAVLEIERNRVREALPLLDRARRGSRGHVARVLPAFAEAEQMSYLHNRHEGDLSGALSLGLRPDAAGAADLSATWLLNGKAVGLESLATRYLQARGGTDAETARIAADLQDTRARLASLTYRLPGPGLEEASRGELRQVRQNELNLSRDLGRRIGLPVRDDPWVELAAVRQALPADAVLVELARFNVFDPAARVLADKWKGFRYAAWVIPPAGKGDVRVIDLGEAAPIEAAVRAVRGVFRDAPGAISRDGKAAAEEQARQALEALSRLVLRPLEGSIGPTPRWLISPDADLWLVPWAALTLSDGKYVIERHRVSHLVSGRDLTMPGAAEPGAGLVVLAGPDYDLGSDEARERTRRLLLGEEKDRATGPGSAHWLPLPGSVREAGEIARGLEKYGGAKPDVYTGERAEEGVLKKVRRPRVLVLSTHGFFAEDQDYDDAVLPWGGPLRGLVLATDRRLAETAPRTRARPLENPLLRCGLVLAGANARRPGANEDGLMTGVEVLGLDLTGTDLVVLPACETGLGLVQNSEGVASLRQAFHLAGARTVVATLWKVPDDETRQLMVGYFDQLAAGYSKADALRRAQLALIRTEREQSGTAHPFYWAAFTVTGDPGTGLSDVPTPEVLGGTAARRWPLLAGAGALVLVAALAWRRRRRAALTDIDGVRPDRRMP